MKIYLLEYIARASGISVSLIPFFENSFITHLQIQSISSRYYIEHTKRQWLLVIILGCLSVIALDFKLT